ncbi:hypothetical protein MRB53_007710 [Persea americana]|uniref:Uncharacterized protein n=1 Tax=Persea americana TaxID=3435 RepID=A0ACC2MLD1_PERAE|nr:hypothetical protein MRB53_007710 [Persea americana]
MNYSGANQIINLWYDWPNGRNFNIVQHQLGKLLYDLEWNNGTSFFYTLDSTEECRVAHLDVGIIRSNWLDGANYLGQEHVDGFLCNVCEKWELKCVLHQCQAGSQNIGENVFTMERRSAHVMTFEVGAVLEDAKWQEPLYCFEKKDAEKNAKTHPVIADGFETSVRQRTLREFSTWYQSFADTIPDLLQQRLASAKVVSSGLVKVSMV